MTFQEHMAEPLLVVASDDALKDRISKFFSRLSQAPLRAVGSIEHGALQLAARQPRLMVVGFRYHDPAAAAEVDQLIRRKRDVGVILVIACPLSEEGGSTCSGCIRKRNNCRRRNRLVVLGAHDYLRLARSSGASMIIERHRPNRITGKIVVHEGQVWGAYDTEGEGADALFRMLDPSAPALFSSRISHEEPGPRHFAPEAFGPMPADQPCEGEARKAPVLTGPHFPVGMIQTANESVGLQARAHGAGKNGAGINGAGTNGAGKNGAGKNGAGKNGAGKNGAGKNGSGRPMLTPASMCKIVSNPDFEDTRSARRAFGLLSTDPKPEPSEKRVASVFTRQAPRVAPKKVDSVFTRPTAHAVERDVASVFTSQTKLPEKEVVSVFTNKVMRVGRTSDGELVRVAQKDRDSRPTMLTLQEDAGLEKLVTTGLEAVLERRFEEAVDLLSRASAIDPDFPRVASTLARLEKLGYASQPA